MVKMLVDPSVNVTEFGKKIVEKYPKDLYGYYGLYFLQVSCGDNRGQIKTVQNALKLKLDSAMLLNQLGYAYMAINKYDSAEIAFNKYLEVATYKPNAYDSKGNYYRRIKEYQKAYDSYMKGYSLDTTFRIPYNKAVSLKKNILDTLKNKQ
jgi:tetratricopeptide (TPR) repeat protein